MVNKKKEFKSISILKYVGVWIVLGAALEIVGFSGNIAIIVAVIMVVFDLIK
ncbi:MAG: hypothetical protein ACRDAU_09920 [Clostridium sp.]